MEKDKKESRIGTAKINDVLTAEQLAEDRKRVLDEHASERKAEEERKELKEITEAVNAQTEEVFERQHKKILENMQSSILDEEDVKAIERMKAIVLSYNRITNSMRFEGDKGEALRKLDDEMTALRQKYFSKSRCLGTLHYKKFVMYYPTGDNRLESHLIPSMNGRSWRHMSRPIMSEMAIDMEGTVWKVQTDAEGKPLRLISQIPEPSGTFPNTKIEVFYAIQLEDQTKNTLVEPRKEGIINKLKDVLAPAKTEVKIQEQAKSNAPAHFQDYIHCICGVNYPADLFKCPKCQRDKTTEGNVFL